MREYNRIANLVISLTQINIFENRRTQKHVDARALFDYIMRTYKNKKLTSIANFYKSKGKSADHSIVLYRINMFDEIKSRRPEFIKWQRIIEQTTISNEEMLMIIEKIKNFRNIDSIEQVVEIVDVLTEKELQKKDSIINSI